MSPKGSLKRLAACAVLVAVGAAPVGCTSAVQSTPGAARVFVAYKPHQANAVQYIIDPPDEITIAAPGIKEIDHVKAVVRPDGKIALNLLGEVRIAGLTPEEGCDHLKQIAEKYYHDPDIKIDVLARSKFYTVFGPGAAAPSKKPFTGNDTILTAIAEAGFNYENAWPQQVHLSRPGKDGAESQTAIIDFKRIFERGDLTQNFILEEGDIIDIPDSPLSRFNGDAAKLVGPLTGVGAGGNAVHSVAH